LGDVGLQFHHKKGHPDRSKLFLCKLRTKRAKKLCRSKSRARKIFLGSYAIFVSHSHFWRSGEENPQFFDVRENFVYVQCSFASHRCSLSGGWSKIVFRRCPYREFVELRILTVTSSRIMREAKTGGFFLVWNGYGSDEGAVRRRAVEAARFCEGVYRERGRISHLQLS